MIVSPRLLRHGRRRFFRRFVFLDALAGLLLVAPSAGGVLGDSTPPAVAPRGRRVLSAWPARPGFQLRRTWIYNGRRHRLRPGVYRWYVRPGILRISASRFGRLLGDSTFAVTK